MEFRISLPCISSRLAEFGHTLPNEITHPDYKCEIRTTVDRGRKCVGLCHIHVIECSQRSVSECPQVLIKTWSSSRNPGVGILTTAIEGSAATSRADFARFPVDRRYPAGESSRAQLERVSYKLVHGAHRLYCSWSAGFKCVPTIEGFDVNP